MIKMSLLFSLILMISVCTTARAEDRGADFLIQSSAVDAHAQDVLFKAVKVKRTIRINEMQLLVIKAFNTDLQRKAMNLNDEAELVIQELESANPISLEKAQKALDDLNRINDDMTSLFEK